MTISQVMGQNMGDVLNRRGLGMWKSKFTLRIIGSLTTFYPYSLLEDLRRLFLFHFSFNQWRATEGNPPRFSFRKPPPPLLIMSTHWIFDNFPSLNLCRRFRKAFFFFISLNQWRETEENPPGFSFRKPPPPAHNVNTLDL